MSQSAPATQMQIKFSNPPFSQQTQFFSPPHLRASKLSTSRNHSGVKEVRASRFDSFSWNAGHSSLGVHCKPCLHSPARSFSYKLNHFRWTYSKRHHLLHHTSAVSTLRPAQAILGRMTSGLPGWTAPPGRQGILAFACSANQSRIHLEMLQVRSPLCISYASCIK